MKKLRKAFLFYFSLMAISVLFQSCCTEEYRIIGSGSMQAYTNDDEYIPIDTIQGQFRFMVRYEQEYSSLENFSLIASSLATSCAYEPLNTILSDEVKISCDQDFIFDGNTIAANSDFSNLEELKIEHYQYRSNELEITFDSLFMEKVTFENQNYTFKVLSKTDDGLELENESTVLMDL